MNITRILVILCVLTGVVPAVKAQETKTAISSKQALITDQINLSNSDIAVFKEQTMQKVKEFEQYIVTLGNKDEPAEKRNMAEKEALKLFYRNAQMYTSFIMPDGTTQVTPRPMEKYLARLKSLPYTKVVIKFYDIAYISEFHKGADGKYYSTATVIQEFNGFTNDQIKYSDITKKDIEIIVDIVEDKFFQEKRWKIYLGDIKATETKALTRT